jgi:hypothetical protein
MRSTDIAIAQKQVQLMRKTPLEMALPYVSRSYFFSPKKTRVASRNSAVCPIEVNEVLTIVSGVNLQSELARALSQIRSFVIA